MFKWLCLVNFFFSASIQAYEYDLSICAIFKNEASYLKEWIEYHRLVGVQHFYLYNHESTDDYIQILQPYIYSGIVDLYQAKNFSRFEDTQVDAYNRGLDKSRYRSRWVAFIDSDEFLMPSKDINLVELLEDYKQFAAVAVNWRSFGTSYIDQLNPHEPMIGQLTRCTNPNHEMNAHIKSIVQPKLTAYFRGAHYAAYKPGYYAVNAAMEKQRRSFNRPVLLDPIRINHYWTRDESYFNHFKKPRRLAWGDTEESLQNYLNDLNVDEDISMLRYVSRLKKAMRL